MLMSVPDEMITKISSYCSNKDICNLSHVCKINAKLRLYRLCISSISCIRFCGTTSYYTLQNELNDIFNFSIKYNYTLYDYIGDLYSVLFNNQVLTSSNDYIYYKYKKFTIEYSHSRMLIDILQNNYRLTKENCNNKNEIRLYNRCHHIYRVCPVAYHKLRRDHFNVLALIY